MKKVVFLILHYYTIDDTVKCIESIDNLNYNNKEIVIVDNASPNDTGDILKEMYKSRKDISIIISETNLGFANGNNLGFKYAKDKLEANFIVMCNNDTFILQKEFCTELINAYKKINFAVLGPKIILKDNSINCLYIDLPNSSYVKKTINYFKKLLFLNYFHLDNIALKVKNKFRKKVIDCKEYDVKKMYENIVLHGCFLCFSEKYISKFDGIDDRTFMYREEELLAIRLKKNDLISVYYPEIEIHHNEYSSTSKITKTKNKKNRFIYKNQIKSCKILLSETLELEKNEKIRTDV